MHILDKHGLSFFLDAEYPTKTSIAQCFLAGSAMPDSYTSFMQNIGLTTQLPIHSVQTNDPHLWPKQGGK